MKNIVFKLTASFLLAATFTPLVMGQKKNAYRLLLMDANEECEEYCRKDSADMTLIHEYFRDTVSVDEMRQAFAKYKDALEPENAFQGYDSVISCPIGENIVLRSALSDNAKKKSESFRKTWAWFGHFALANVQDSEGKPQEKMLKALREDKLQGDFVTMREPRRYMGYTVSPHAYAERYENGKVTRRSGSNSGYADFFSQIQRTKSVFDGDWYHYVNDGVRLLGLLFSINTSVNIMPEQCSFSVLLYESGGHYSLELLSTDTSDENTAKIFDALKRMVSDFPERAIKPYYTSDFRVLPGRFYRITSNSCGILVQDYL